MAAILSQSQCVNISNGVAKDANGDVIMERCYSRLETYLHAAVDQNINNGRLSSYKRFSTLFESTIK